MLMRFLKSCVLLASTSLLVRAASVCSVSTTGLAFGSYDPVHAHDSDITGTLIVSCSGTVGEAVSFQVILSPGRGTYQNRLMIASGQPLHYNVFLDPTRTLVWGDGTQGTHVLTDVLHLTVPSVSKSYVVYGRVLGNQHQVKAQSYWDNLVVTIKF